MATKSKGKHLNFKAHVSEESYRSLNPIYEVLNGIDSSHEIMPPERLHITITYFGVPSVLRKEISSLSKTNPYSKLFVSHFEQCIDACKSAAKETGPIDVKVSGIAFYGEDNDVLALNIEHNDKLLKLRQISEMAFRDFLVKCGVDNDGILHLSKHDEFRYSIGEVFKPHITLARNFSIHSGNTDNLHLPKSLLLKRADVSNTHLLKEFI